MIESKGATGSAAAEPPFPGSFHPSGQALATEPPLVVDMDGTLVHTDTLYEGFVQAWRRNPLLPLALPWWLLRGKAALKHEIARRVELDVESLPYDEPVIAWLREEHQRRSVVLCSAADHRFARAVARHIGVFDEVIATADGVNLSAGTKARALAERFGSDGFDYAGNDTSDLAVFARARRAHVVNPTAALRRRAGSIANLERVERRSARRASLRAYVRALRPHQWAKNLLVYVPLLGALNEVDLADALPPATLALISFCLVASGVYLLNDLFDLGADRRHARKRNRPLAAGTLPIRDALLMLPALLGAGLVVAATISALFVALLALYGVCTTLYTFWLKRVPLLDTLVLAGLYTLRVLAGAAAVEVVPSFWLLAFSMFFFLSLALAKRHSELLELQASAQPGGMPGRGYRPEDLSTLISQGSASGYAAVLVLALFIDSDSVRGQYNHPEIIWLICPLVLYWINKLWLNSQRREVEEDPVIWAITNRVSRGLALLSVGLLLLAKFLP